MARLQKLQSFVRTLQGDQAEGFHISGLCPEPGVVRFHPDPAKQRQSFLQDFSSFFRAAGFCCVVDQQGSCLEQQRKAGVILPDH